MINNVNILGIESSCDDTSASIVSNGYVLSNIIANQEVHKKFGGVVPELASRAHQQNIIPVIESALNNANIKLNEISAIAFTKGPGLLGSLLVGTSFAKSFAIARDIPLIAVNHMEGHIIANFIKNEKTINDFPKFPFLNLTVSGGHTQIVLVKSLDEMEVIGETLDDAAGEAFDKSAKLLGLEYPGGPLIDKYSKDGNNNRFKFGKHKVKDFNFSFSGIKTSILRLVEMEVNKNKNFINENLSDLCASIQHTIVDILIMKIIDASEKLNINEIAIGGGVSANTYFRYRLMELKNTGKNVYIPKFEYCTDNAAMIAMVGYNKFINNQFNDLNVIAESRFPI